MKITYHVPSEQYGFIELENEQIEELTPATAQMAVEGYKRLSEAVKCGEGLPDKDFQAFVIRQLLGGEGNHIEEYNKMSEFQQKVVQENKKALQTIKRKNAKDGLTDL